MLYPVKKRALKIIEQLKTRFLLINMKLKHEEKIDDIGQFEFKIYSQNGEDGGNDEAACQIQ